MARRRTPRLLATEAPSVPPVRVTAVDTPTLAAAHTPAPAPEPTPAPAPEPTPAPTPVTAAAAPEPAPVPVVHAQAQVRDAFPYRPGGAHSMFRDMVHASMDPDAAARSRQAQAMLTAAGTAGKTTNLAEVIPPGYRPDMYLGELPAGRPVIDAFTSYTITDATPFKIPVFGTATGLIADHVEGTNPTTGTITMDDLTVTPKAVSGVYDISREAIDAANPNLDAIIMAAIREAYAQATETYVATTLVTGATAGTDGTGTAAIVAELAKYPGRRKATPDVILVAPSTFSTLAAEVSTDGRPLNPWAGASNADGTLGQAAASLVVVGLLARNAWSLSTDDQVIVGKRSDAASFESGLRTWRWEEVAGPANIRFAAFGYVAAAVLRASGVVKFLAAAPAPAAP